MTTKIIFHIDVNNAFLSWSAVKYLQSGQKLDIRTIPSIIEKKKKTRRGIVLAKSPIAKKYGIQTAETIYAAKKKCPTLQVYPTDYRFYYQKSRELMEYLSSYSPSLEQLSVDECFLDMTGMNYLYENLIELAYKIKKEIKEKFGYTVNIGIANNKLCAKMASDFEKPDKVHTLFSSEIEEKLWPLDVRDLYMCGKKTSERLHKLGIHTIGDLAKANEKLIEKEFKTQGIYLKKAAMGIDDSKVEKHQSKNPSISISETLPYDFDQIEKIKEILFRQVEELSRELRSKKLYTKTVTITFKNQHFQQYSAQTTIENPTNQTKDLLNISYHLLEKNYRGDSIRLVGVKLSGLTSKKSQQIDLFKPIDHQEMDNIQETIDSINNKFGKSIIKPASLEMIGESKSKKSLKDE